MMSNKNVLIIHTDEHVYSFLGCMGNKQVKTPNIDSLANEGFLFTNSYSCNGVCVPSRASLMTGRYPIATGVGCNEQKLSPHEITMGRIFKSAGYSTGYFGKTHYGLSNEDVRKDGWDTTFLWQEEYNEFLKKNNVNVHYPEKQEIRRDDIRYWNIGSSNIPNEYYFENVIADKAVDYIKGQKDNKFLCFVGNIAPHGPFSPPKPYDTMYNPDDMELAPRFENELENKPPEFIRWVKQNQKYVTEKELKIYMAHLYGLISLVDDNVGKICKALKEAGTYDNTIIIFTCDHGDFSGKYGILGKSWCMDECLVRTHLVVSHPEHRKSCGQKIDALVENVDILPTILDYAGIKQHGRMQGKSFMPVILGEKEKTKEEVYAYNEHHTSDAHLHQTMIRKGKWKLVQSHNFKGELYNLEEDPAEATNLIDNPVCKEIINGLREKILTWHIGNLGTFFDTENNSYWEESVNFYDEKNFLGG
jgi:arylsulfatase A-like enzyme